MEDYLDGKEPSIVLKQNVLEKVLLKDQICSSFMWTAFKNKGVQPLLDAVVDYLPSPKDIGFVEGIKDGTDEKYRKCNTPEEPFAALAFKVATDPLLDSLNFCRLYCGTYQLKFYNFKFIWKSKRKNWKNAFNAC
jgi:elongation factor G